MQTTLHKSITLSTLALLFVATSIATVQARGAGGEREIRGMYTCSEAGGGSKSAKCGTNKTKKNKKASLKIVYDDKGKPRIVWE